jgi:hypothetical protein
MFKGNDDNDYYHRNSKQPDEFSDIFRFFKQLNQYKIKCNNKPESAKKNLKETKNISLVTAVTNIQIKLRINRMVKWMF